MQLIPLTGYFSSMCTEVEDFEIWIIMTELIYVSIFSHVKVSLDIDLSINYANSDIIGYDKKSILCSF